MRFGIALVSAGVLAIAFGASVPEGENGVSSYMIGGDKVNPADRPYTVRLRFRKSADQGEIRYCGGVRINNFWIITAAECLDTKKYNHVEVVYPTDNPVSGYGKTSFMFTFNNGYYVVHPKYNENEKSNNIGMLVCVKCTKPPAGAALPVLPKHSNESEWDFATVAGWTVNDATAENQAEDSVRSFRTGIVKHFVCKLIYFFRSVTDEHICAGSSGGNRLTPAHVGVPLVADILAQPSAPGILIGIASPVQPWTTVLPVPTVFTKIAPHVDWIRLHAGL